MSVVINKKVIVSARDFGDFLQIIKSRGIDRKDAMYISHDRFLFSNDVRDGLRGVQVESEEDLIGKFTSAEREYMTRNIKPKTFSFSKALELLKQGKSVKRLHWGGYWFIPENSIVHETLSHGHSKVSKMNQMIVACLKDNGGYVPATPYQDDLLAEDWIEVK